MSEFITSRQNTQIKKLDALLRQKKAREQYGFFVLEGAKLCLDAYNSGMTVEELYLSQEAKLRCPELAPLVLEAKNVIFVDNDLAGRIAGTKTTQGVFAVCKTPDLPVMPEISGQGRYLLLHRIRDPGNLGSILRTAAALGVSGVILSDCVELYSPKVLRASMGGIWRLQVAVCPDMMSAINQLRAKNVRVIAAALGEGSSKAEMLSFKGGLAVLIGNEGSGLPDELIAAADEIIKIPMKGESQSLGAAMAAGILLWEMLKDR